MESTLKPHDIMISYSTKLKRVADDVCHFLCESGYDVWMAPYSIPNGGNYYNEIYAAIDNSKIVLFLLSEPSLQSEWCQNELRYAIESNKIVLPVQIKEVDNPYDKMGQIRPELQRRQILKLYPRYKSRLDEIVDSVKKLLSGAERVPQPYPVLTSEYSTQNLAIVGREGEIRDIRAALQVHRILNVYGMGGIGKSSVLKKYCATYLNSGGYLSIHLAKFNHSIKNTVAAIPFVGLNDLEYWESLKDPSLTKEEALMEKKLSLLDNLGTTCLLIIDGADYLDEGELEPLYKISCPIILVSRNRYSNERLGHYELKEMVQSDLVDLFVSYSKIIPSETEREAVVTILEAIGGHTLTAKLIACYCQNMGMVPSEVLGEGVLANLAQYDTHHERVTTLLDNSRLTEGEIYALQLLSLFPNGVLKGKFQKLDRETLRLYPQLVEKGWVIGTDSSYQLHQIVREIVVTKYKLTSQNIAPFLTRFAALFRQIGIEGAELSLILRQMYSVISGEDFLMAHALHLFGNCLCDMAYASFFHVSPVTYETQDMNFHAKKNEKKAHYEQFRLSLQMNQRAYEIASALEKREERKIIPYILSYMGSANFNMNEFRTALNYQQRALEAAKEYLQETEFEYGVILDRIGLTALEVQEYQTALEAFTAYREVAVRNGLRDFNYAMAAYHIGLAHFLRRDYGAAKEWFTRAEEELNDDKETSFGYSELCLNLAQIHREEGKAALAREYYLKSRAIKARIVEDEEALAEFTRKYDKIYLSET